MSKQIFTSGSKDMRDGSDVLRCQSCLKMAGPQSRVAGGGFWSQPQAQYSASTHKLLKGISNFNFSSVLYKEQFSAYANWNECYGLSWFIVSDKGKFYRMVLAGLYENNFSKW